ncbi:MAG: putative MAPEG superfamily protein [Myxococcota bacterium]|jgi:uncharacterized MAPEG superfamily protein
MTVDLWMLVAAVVLTWVQILIAATPGLLMFPKWATGNRDGSVDIPTWAQRMDRAAQNMKENLPMFAALVLIAHVSGEADATSALGAQIFVGARIAHGIIYPVGIPVVRTLVWSVSVAGMGMIIASLF